ncbi:MAG: hypothetical protein ACREMX_02775 [Gemmatimonadales bacterium]
MRPARALLWGTLTVGLLDGLDAIVFFGYRGVTPVQVLQSIASGLLGRAAFEGGAATAALGALLHFFIAFAVVAAYHLASRWLPSLTRHPWSYGPLYGLFVYVVMNQVVVPLSAAVSGPEALPVIINGLLIHALGVGLPAALFARASRPNAPRP